MPLFDRYIVVDWSAAAKPTLGADSIWVARRGCSDNTTLNVATRADAVTLLDTEIAEAVRAGERLFIGLDFAFGYPVGTDALPGGGGWTSVWSWLHAHIDDSDDNANNRFAVASELNARFEQAGPFWGHPRTLAGRHLHLSPFKPDYAALGVRERRHIDARVPRAQPVWKLAYPGSVGSQALMGIARVEGLRKGIRAASIAIWPFETRFAENLGKPVVLAEIYPSLYSIERRASVPLDRVQVETLADGFADNDRADRFESMLDGPRRSPEARRDACSHEGWMVGFADDIVSL